MYLYVLPPIEIGWESLRIVADVAADAARADTRDLLARYEDAALMDEDAAEHHQKCERHNDLDRLSRLLEMIEDAFTLALRHGWWAGRFRNEARVLPIPHDGAFLYAIVWKEEGTGIIYLASPVELPHLEQIAIAKTYDRAPLSC